MVLSSIRFKITLWYMLILGVTLLIFSVSVYQNFSGNLYGDLDDLLQSKAEGIVRSINTYWQAQEMDAAKEGSRASAAEKKDRENFLRIVRQWAQERSDDAKIPAAAIQIFDRDGRKIAASASAPDALNIPLDTLNSALEEEDDFYDFRPEGKQALPLRVYATPIIEDGKVSYIVQVASPVNQVYAALDNLKMNLLIFLPLTVLITGVAGSLLAKLTLNPVTDMVKTIRQITAENLKLRVKIPGSRDEIKKLADTFNDMLAKLESSFYAQRKFIQDISHELKTPLTILKGEFEVALQRIRSADEYEDTLLSSLEEVDRISKIVDNLLILVRFDSQEIPFKFQPVELKQLIQGVVNDISVLSNSKNIMIDFTDSDPLPLTADESYLRRVFLNILDNAVKYTPESGAVSIALRAQEPYAVIRISDNGPGIVPEELPHIFERFYRGGSSSRAGSGFGLGLAIAKSIAEAHKGRIEAQSRLGQGTTFNVFLPLFF